VVARPLDTFDHESRGADAARIAAVAAEQGVELILVGLALDASGQVGPAARHAEYLADSIRGLTEVPVVLHDESFSTQAAREAMLVNGRRRQDRQALIHAASAAAILQSYLDAHSSE